MKKCMSLLEAVISDYLGQPESNAVDKNDNASINNNCNGKNISRLEERDWPNWGNVKSSSSTGSGWSPRGCNCRI